MIRVGIGQDSHRFEEGDSKKPLILGGIPIDNCPGLSGNSDADVVLHAITNAISGVTCENTLGEASDKMCLEQGIICSEAYLAAALKFLGNARVIHLSISIEAQRPKITPHIEKMRERIAQLVGIYPKRVGITATSGEGLSAFGKGEGIYCTVIATLDTLD